jgi:hydroxypyruvate isomerase
VADVPGRHEPGTGEINFSAVVKALHDAQYDGTLGMEALPLGDGNEAMRRFREIFEK